MNPSKCLAVAALALTLGCGRGASQTAGPATTGTTRNDALSVLRELTQIATDATGGTVAGKIADNANDVCAGIDADHPAGRRASYEVSVKVSPSQVRGALDKVRQRWEGWAAEHPGARVDSSRISSSATEIDLSLSYGDLHVGANSMEPQYGNINIGGSSQCS